MKASVMAPAGGLKGAFRSLLSVVRSERDKPLFVSVDEGQLSIEIVGTAALVPVIGEWDVRIRVGNGAVAFWADAPYPGDFVHVRVEDGRLMVGGHGIGCEVVTAPEPMLDLQSNPSFKKLISMGYHSEQRALENAGLWGDVCKAREYLGNLIYEGLDHQEEDHPRFPRKEVEQFIDHLQGNEKQPTP